MICKNCGKTMEPDSLFCPMCGARTEPILPPEAAAASVRETEVPASYTEDIPKPIIPDVHITEEKCYTDSSPAVRVAEAAEKEETGFFGVGAFVLCVIVIALLSVTSGVFAALYFNAIGG